MRRRRLPASLIGLALVAVASGCTTQSASHTPSTQPNIPRFENGGTVVVAVPSLPTNFNPSSPQGANRITSEVMEQVWPQTFVTDSQLAATTEPGFLEAAEVEGVSPFTVVYTLNPKAVWSDGTPIGVADFVYNWHEQVRWAPDLPEGGLAAGYDSISSITSSNGGSTIAVRFSQPFSEWESLFSDLVPAHIGERYGWVAAFEGFHSSTVVSGGPFEITSYVAGVRLVLSRNPHYWFRKPPLAHIILQVEPSNEALNDLQVGAVDIAEVADGAVVDGVLANAAREGIALTKATVELPVLWQLCFNTTDPVVGSSAFRAGIEESLYLDEITSDSVGLSDASVQPYDSRLTLGAGSQAGPGSNGLGNGSSSSPSASSGSIVGYDPAAALASFQSAGYVSAPTGVLHGAGTGLPVTLSLVVPAGDPAVRQAAAVIQAELRAVGIRVVLHTPSLTTLLGSTLPSGNYQMALAPFLLTTFAASQSPVYSGSVLPPGTLPSPAPGNQSAIAAARRRSSDDVGAEPGAVGAGVVTRDVFGLDDPTVATDLSQALTNLNPTDDQNLIVAADARLWSDLPTIPLFQEPVALVHATEIRAVSDSPTWAGMFWDAEDWAIQVTPPVTPTSVPPIS